MNCAYRELSTGTLIGVSGLASIVWVLILGIAAPISISDTLGLLQRLAYFATIGVVCWPAGHALAAMLLYFVRLSSRPVVTMTAVAGALYTAANIGAVAYAVNTMFIPADGELQVLTVYLLSAVVAVPHSGLLYFLARQRAKYRAYDAITESAANAQSAAAPAADANRPHTDSSRPGDGSPQTPSPSPAPSEPHARFLNRLPAKLGRDIVYVKVNGHYLKVVTTDGSGALLMRLADAVQELGEAGMQVHRSSWVAHRHITGVVQRDDKTLVRVTGGDEIPVSRTYRAAVNRAVAC